MRKDGERGGEMKYKKSVFRSLSLVMQLGLSVVTPIFLCVFAGNYIDSRFGVQTMVPLLILGTLAGGRSAYVLAQRMIAAEQRDDEEEKTRLEKEAEGYPLPHVLKPKQPSRVRTGAKATDKEDENE